jgi:hypothetical protein
MAGQSISKSWLIFRRGIRYSYDYLGMVMRPVPSGFLWVSLPMLVVTSFSNYIQNPAVIGVAIVLTVQPLGPATAAVHGMIVRSLTNEDVRVREFFRHFRFFWRGVGLILLNVLILADPGFGSSFYAQQSQ